MLSVSSRRSGVALEAGLSRAQVEALAERLAAPGLARQVLAEAGIHRADLPWNPQNPRSFWTAVSDLLADGVAVDGRARLLAVLGTRYPGEPLFADSTMHPSEQPVDGAPQARRALWNVPARLARFVGRDDQLAELAEKLDARSGVESVVALAGMGGVGKTSLAIEFAHRARERYDVTWWIPAERPEFVTGHLAELGERLGLTPGAEPGAVFAELTRRNLRWLLILDNAESTAAVAPFRPTDGRGRVLVTSRRTGWRGLGDTVEVPTLARAEAVALLTGHLPGADPAEADRVADLLGDLALAVEQAAAFCEQTGTPLSEIAELLTERLDDVLGLGEVVERADVTVETLWELSTRQVAQAQPAAVELLQLLALSAPEPLPLDLISGHADLLGDGPLAQAAADRLAWTRTVGTLIGYSLASRSHDATAISVHRLVQAATRRSMTDTRRTEWLVVLLYLLSADLPNDIGRNPKAWPRWRALLPHVRAVLARAGTDPDASPPAPTTGSDAMSYLYDLTAGYLLEHGQFAEALPLAQRALAIDEALHGPDHPNVVAATLTIGEALRALGRAAEALPLQRRALAITEAAHGPDHPFVANILVSFAKALGSEDRNAEALPLLRRALAIDEAAHRPDHPVLAVDLLNLAETLRDLDRAAEALPLAERALTIDEATYGPDSPDVADDLTVLAATLQDLGRAAEALPHAQRGLAIYEATYGPDHPTLTVILTRLAQVLRDLQRADEADPLLHRALATNEAVYGPHHPRSTSVRTLLAE
ncbi:FxSxx-COOH system tetratricopeptide repeat protein [Pseudofrankia sp. BMG5.36]|uniref:FxSxx-COOH system tetratricopeptide repeat protein n=1 Tax=Pseudofrankia sp. BMG5.36 TaxID=1834512 RepID=UPI0008D9DA3B|nr:FxSxx-COOH system tetratricopeptide repeat protein [Pseudofrankia sp. BMG5.36]OHV73983.1 hypothetical protein BCD48_32820 [Pseudofrankia sp. BMG5.36]